MQEREGRVGWSSQEGISGGSQLSGPNRVVEDEEVIPGERNKIGTERVGRGNSDEGTVI